MTDVHGPTWAVVHTPLHVVYIGTGQRLSTLHDATLHDDRESAVTHVLDLDPEHDVDTIPEAPPPDPEPTDADRIAALDETVDALVLDALMGG